MPGDVLKINPNVAVISPSSVAPMPPSEPTQPYVHTANKTDVPAGVVGGARPEDIDRPRR